MPRAGLIRKRLLPEDPVFGSRLVTRLINRTMRSGKKTAAQKQVYGAFALLKGKGQDPLAVFNQAIENIKPAIEVRPRRVGGAAYQVPMPVRAERRETLAIRWLLKAANARPNKEYHSFAQKLAAEITDAAQNTGGAIKKKLDIQRMAEANRAFAHFRW